MTTEIPGAAALLAISANFYTVQEVRPRIPGTKQNIAYHLKAIKECAGFEDRGVWYFDKKLTNRYFHNWRRSSLAKMTPNKVTKKKKLD